MVTNNSFADIFDEVNSNWINEMKSDGKSNEEITKLFSSSKYSDFMKNSIKEISKIEVQTLQETMEDRIKKEKLSNQNFLKHIDEVWGKGLIAFEAMYIISVEAAELYCKYISELDKKEHIEKNYLFLALRQLHARSCQIFLEIFCLLQNGFADGAYARWRSLYERNIIADFISQNGEEVAKSFCEQSEYNKDYEWARTAICFKEYKKSYITFNIIRKKIDVNTSYWYKQNKISSNIIHASPYGAFKSLGNNIKSKPSLSAGRSVFGLSTPAELSAISLSWISDTFFSLYSNIDTVVYKNCLNLWIDVVREHFFTISYKHNGDEKIKNWLDEYKSKKNVNTDKYEV